MTDPYFEFYSIYDQMMDALHSFNYDEYSRLSALLSKALGPLRDHVPEIDKVVTNGR